MAEAGPTRSGGRGRGPRRGGHHFAQKPSTDPYEEVTGGCFTKKRKIMDDVYRFLVREDLVRSIIGKGGEHLKIIKEEAKAVGIETKVSIYAQGANGACLMEGAIDRVMSIQSTVEGLRMALLHLLPSVQIRKPGRAGAQKLELRLIVPAHCCSGIIGKGGSVIKKMKDTTKSYIQVYTLPLPMSEEYCVRIQNFEPTDLVNTAVMVFETIADIKGKNPITMYDPIYFEHGEYGDTGSYIDTEWYQEALRAGVAKPTPYKAVRHGYHSYSGDYGYDGYGYGYSEGGGYGYEGQYYDHYDYTPPPQQYRGRGQYNNRGASRRGSKHGTRYHGNQAEPEQIDCADLIDQ